jgi:tRNA(adenine34) deaminase
MRKLEAIPLEIHERAMRLAIAEARHNPSYPFGAVIIRAADGEVMARGANNDRVNPVLHGEIACLNDYVAHHGNKGWEALILYTTGEPCPMCMSALVWAGIGGVVFASSIDAIRRGRDQPDRDRRQGGGGRLTVLSWRDSGRRIACRDGRDVSTAAPPLAS